MQDISGITLLRAFTTTGVIASLHSDFSDLFGSKCRYILTSDSDVPVQPSWTGFIIRIRILGSAEAAI